MVSKSSGWKSIVEFPSNLVPWTNTKYLKFDIIHFVFNLIFCNVVDYVTLLEANCSCITALFEICVFTLKSICWSVEFYNVRANFRINWCLTFRLKTSPTSLRSHLFVHLLKNSNKPISYNVIKRFDLDSTFTSREKIADLNLFDFERSYFHFLMLIITQTQVSQTCHEDGGD